MLTRALVVLLLILNLGVALWWATREEVAPVPGEAAVDARERLRLLSETGPDAPVQVASAAGRPPAPEAEGAEVVAGPVPETVAGAPPVCHALGPYADRAGADRASAVLQPRVLRLSLRESRSAPRGWRVQLSGLADRGSATATAARLVAAGFSDHYLMPAAESGRTDIALGRFGSEAAAQRHQSALRAAGFEAVAEPIGDSERRYWIDVVAGAEVEAIGLQQAADAPQAERIDCAAPGG